jgi:hypothetical protein
MQWLVALAFLALVSSQSVNNQIKPWKPVRPVERVAVVWVFSSDLPEFLPLSLATLLSHKLSILLDVIILAHKIPGHFKKQKGGFWNRVYFHEISFQEWTKRIQERLGLNISYSFEVKPKKIADLKPMLGYLFPDIISPRHYEWWIYGDSDGFFGSYDDVLNYKALFRYDVISGYSVIRPYQDAFSYGGTEHYALGSWTMLRNTPRINSLFLRSINLRSMLLDGAKVYAFDENTDSGDGPGQESFHVVLSISDDIRRCCYNNRIPQVRNDEANSLIVIDMDGDFLKNDAITRMRWERNKSIRFQVEGRLGGNKVFKNQSVSGLFFHILQWKYIRPSLYNNNLRAFLKEIENIGGYHKLNCFDLITNASVFMSNLFYQFKLC